MAVKHPARFSVEILDRLREILRSRRPERALDPFAGTGLVHSLGIEGSVGVELEPEWARLSNRTVVGNALRLPFADGTFDALITSPTYGSRMADSHNARDGSVRRSYTHDLRDLTGDPDRSLHPDNSGTLHWGARYQEFHDRAWSEVLRTMTPGALLLLNVGNHFRTVGPKGKRRSEEQHVIEWHVNWFLDHGCVVDNLYKVDTKGMRYGRNRSARLGWEAVVEMTFVAPVLTPEEETPDAHVAGSVYPQVWPDLVDHLDPREGGQRT